jgi:hypothetical protein
VVGHIAEQAADGFEGVPVRRHVTEETGHGRQETRIYLQLPAPKTLPGFSQWAGLRTIGMVTPLCLRDGRETAETRYFVSSLPWGVRQFARAVRGHWAVENGCHWSLD